MGKGWGLSSPGQGRAGQLELLEFHVTKLWFICPEMSWHLNALWFTNNKYLLWWVGSLVCRRQSKLRPRDGWRFGMAMAWGLLLALLATLIKRQLSVESPKKKKKRACCVERWLKHHLYRVMSIRCCAHLIAH